MNGQSIAVVVAVSVEVVWITIDFLVLRPQIELDRVEPDDDESRTTFFTRDGVSLLGLGVDKNFFGAFGTNGTRHWEISRDYFVVCRIGAKVTTIACL
jgi:hypothetical protein